MTFSQRFDDVRARARQGIPGSWVYSSRNNDSACGINASPQAAQVGTIVVDTATNDATYTWTINGVEMTYTADGSTSASEVALGIAEVINEEPLVRGQVRASASSATVTLTATVAGTVGAFTASDSDAKLTTTEESTADADAADVAFGRAIVSLGTISGESERSVCIPTTARLTAQVQTITVTYVASAVLLCRVWEIRGSERVLIGQAAVTSATDRDTTLDALITAINANLPANSVVVTADNASATALVFTAEIAGLEFVAEITHGGGGASAPTITPADTTGPSRSTSLHRAWQGISLYSTAAEAAAVGDTTGVYAGSEGVVYAKRGCVWVDSAQTPTEGSVVYVELAAGSTAGRFYTDSSATRVALSRAFACWERDGITSSDGIAAIRLK